MTTQGKAAIVESFNELVCFTDILDEMIQTLGENSEPQDVYDEEQLATWAENNGYVKAE